MAMVNILVRNIDAETARRLKDKATADGASVNETARKAIAEYVKPDKAELWAKADAIRKKIGKVSGDSTDIIRKDRDSR
jgi:plasmid stability protein